MSPRVLVISHDVIGSRMAGPGIRAWELGRVLAEHQPVTLVAPQPIDRAAPGVRCGSYTWGDRHSLAPWLHAADVVVANGFVLLGHAELADLSTPLVLDLYDPTLLENVEVGRSAPPDQRSAQSQQDIALLQRQLAAGDFFVCATERQRDLYIGALMAAGRITAESAADDPDLRALIDVVPTGLPSLPPRHQQDMLRGVVPGIGAHDVVLLWSGGLWDWMEPLALIAALPRVVARHPNLRLVFLAGQHPGAIQPMAMPDRARAAADASGLLHRHIFFYDQWVPYDERANFLLEADIAVYLHRAHLETRYAAVRSRMLDHVWAGLPSVVSAGDAAADLVERHDLGCVVSDATPDAVADALLALLDDPERRARSAANAQQYAHHLTWQRTVEPLARFCAAPALHRARATVTPSPAHTLPAPPQAAPHTTMTNEHVSSIRHMEQSWQFGVLPPQRGPRAWLQRLVLRLLAPVIAQQRAFNAAVVQHSYQAAQQPTPAALDSMTQASLNAVLAQTVSAQHMVSLLQNELNALQPIVHALNTSVAAWYAQVPGELDALQARVAAAQHAIDEHTTLFRQLKEQVGDADTLQARLQELAYVHHRVSALSDTLQLLNDAVAEHDRTQAELADHVAHLAQPAYNTDQPHA